MDRLNPSTADSNLAVTPESCITCSDQALAGRVLQLLAGGMAQVEIDGRVFIVNLSLIEAAPGDIVFVHADVAIAKLSAQEGDSESDA